MMDAIVGVTDAGARETTQSEAPHRDAGDLVPIEAALTLLTELRDIVMQRVQQVNQTSEAEVLRAGAEVEAVVALGEGLGRQMAAFAATQSSEVGDEPAEAGLGTVLAAQSEALRHFVRDMGDGLGSLHESSEQAARESDNIASMGRHVQAIAQQAKMLALNARIEAARCGEDGAGFRVIAGEMGRLSTQIEEANVAIEHAAQSLTRRLPALASRAAALNAETSEFRARQDRQLAEVARGTEAFAEQTRALAQAATRGLEEIDERAGRVLSALQFQDPAAQYLRIAEADFANAREALLSLAQATARGGSETISLRAAAEHREAAAGSVASYGDEATADSGEVMFF